MKNQSVQETNSKLIKLAEILKKESTLNNISIPRTVRMLKSCRVLEHGNLRASGKKVGDTAIVSGDDKIHLLETGLAELIPDNEIDNQE